MSRAIVVSQSHKCTKHHHDFVQMQKKKALKRRGSLDDDLAMYIYNMKVSLCANAIWTTFLSISLTVV